MAKYTIVIEVDTDKDPATLEEVERHVVAELADTWYITGDHDPSQDCRWSCRIVRPIDPAVIDPQSSAS